jgi:pimeloyl-ACP methyl ester carboxylesterase
MSTFPSHHATVNGVDIHVIDEGPREGAPILLIHGFASNLKTNWIDPLWVKFLTGNGRRVVAMDCRGHGQSAKLYRQEDYGSPLMAEDARALLDHLGIAKADVMGYSMGARITAFLAMNHPERVHTAIFGGLGINMVHVPRLCRGDQERPEGARHVHPLGTCGHFGRDAADDQMPGSGRGRHGRRHRWIGVGAG